MYIRYGNFFLSAYGHPLHQRIYRCIAYRAPDYLAGYRGCGSKSTSKNGVVFIKLGLTKGRRSHWMMMAFLERVRSYLEGCAGRA